MKLEITDKKVWFTSDTHYAHKNICRGVSDWKKVNKETGILEVCPESTRPFETLEEMNEAIVNNINNTVGEDDILFHIGDWSFGGVERILEFRKQIKCKNIYLILGNHDHHLERERELRGHFTLVRNYLEITLVWKDDSGKKKTQALVLFHYPLVSWNQMYRNVLMIHGHVHTKEERRFGNGKLMDVGMDGSPEFRPYSLSEVQELLAERVYIGTDYHATMS
jgi:calcineurin-like phosphoesterase family protein